MGSITALIAGFSKDMDPRFPESEAFSLKRSRRELP